MHINFLVRCLSIPYEEQSWNSQTSVIPHIAYPFFLIYQTHLWVCNQPELCFVSIQSALQLTYGILHSVKNSL